MKRSMVFRLAPAAALVPAVSSPVLAQHHGDVFLHVVNNRIATALIDEDGDVRLNRRVFESEFGEVAPDFTDEPGFDSDPGTFDPGSELGFNILRALRVWDGAAFAVIPDERLDIAFGPLGPVTTPPIDEIVPGFTVGVSPDGSWHNHLEYYLGAPAATGIYLLELNLFSSDAALRASKPFWLVFNQNDSEENHELAVGWVRQNLVPAPPAAWLLAATCVGPRRRRRQPSA